MSALTSYQTLTAWLENQSVIVNAKPDGLSNGSSSGAWKETCRQASAIVERQPMYDLVKSRLIEWTTLNFPESDDDFILCRRLHDALYDDLLKSPFYAVTTAGMEETSRMPVHTLSVDVVASDMGINRKTLYSRLTRHKTSFPFGSYTDKGVWFINPGDLPGIKALFEKSEKSA